MLQTLTGSDDNESRMTIDLKKMFGDLTDLDTKSANALLKALKGAFTDDFGYLRFKQSVNSMQEMGLDQSTAIKSAFATASTMGLTKDGLVKSAKKYKLVLKQEREKFAEALKGQLSKKVDGERKEAEALQKKIVQMQRKIEQMQKEIALYQKKIDNVEGKVDAAKSKIVKTKDNFVAAYDKIAAVIEEDIAELESIL